MIGEFVDPRQVDQERPERVISRGIEAIENAKASADAAAFKAWLRQISQSTAEAPSEGGGLFGGGVQVSDAEKARRSPKSRARSVFDQTGKCRCRFRQIGSEQLLGLTDHREGTSAGE